MPHEVTGAKRRPDGPPGPNADFTFTLIIIINKHTCYMVQAVQLQFCHSSTVYYVFNWWCFSSPLFCSSSDLSLWFCPSTFSQVNSHLMYPIQWKSFLLHTRSIISQGVVDTLSYNSPEEQHNIFTTSCTYMSPAMFVFLLNLVTSSQGHLSFLKSMQSMW